MSQQIFKKPENDSTVDICTGTRTYIHRNKSVGGWEGYLASPPHTSQERTVTTYKKRRQQEYKWFRSPVDTGGGEGGAVPTWTRASCQAYIDLRILCL